jgi:lysozyme
LNRRWWIATAALLVAAVGIGGAYLYFREYEPDRSRFPVRGIDVSHHQKTIDWPKVAADDVAFAYLKASEGGDHRDREFVRNLAEAKRIGLPVGAYHFFTFCRPAADQAKNFIDAVPPGATELPPVVDLEFYGNCERRPSKEELGQEVETFLGTVEAHFDRAAVYYVTDEFLDAYGGAIRKRPIWIRSIMREPGEGGWAIWQYHPAGRVAGIEGDVDLNVLSGRLDQLVNP